MHGFDVAIVHIAPGIRKEVAHHILTVTLRFSPRLGFSPVTHVLANSNAATAALAGPSHISAVIGRTRSRQPFGSPGPVHQALSVPIQICAALAWPCRTSARAVMERSALSLWCLKTTPTS